MKAYLLGLLKRYSNYKIKKIKQKQLVEFKKNMQDVYNFIKWLEKQLTRKERKQFWHEVADTGFVNATYVKRFMENYTK